MKGVMRLGKKGKLSPRFVGPFEILSRVGEVAYKLALPPSLSAVHPVFHALMLRKYIPDESHVISLDSVELGPDLTYEEEPIAILDRQIRKFRTKELVSVKVQWKHRSVREATWRQSLACVPDILNFLKLQVITFTLCSRTDMIFSGG